MIKGFDVVFLVDAEEFLNKLDDRAKRKIIGNIFKSRYMMNTDLFKKLHHDIWEFRTIHLRRHFRFLAFWDKRQHPVKVVVTHGVLKKSDKLPHHEIEKALNIKSQYLKEER